MTELKPCPFCGGKAHVCWSLPDMNCIVMCGECNCRTPEAYYNRRRNFVRGGIYFRRCKTSEEARALVIETWNMRKN